MSDTKTIRTLRNMAWARAKGELNSILETYWPEYQGNIDVSKYSDMKEAIDTFISIVEDNGYQE